MTAPSRPLAGCRVGLSISESEDSETRGFPLSQVNRVTVQAVSALFGQGVSVVFGHDWREDGVMQAIHAFAREMQPSDAGSEDRPQLLLQNLLPWPDEPMLPDKERQQLSSALLVERAGLPDELRYYADALPAAAIRLPDYRYIRARGLTHMRRSLEERTHARICIGGRRIGGQGRFPGVIEEAFLTSSERKPLYLVGLLGGAARQVISAFEGDVMPDDFCGGSTGADVYASAAMRLERSSETLEDRDTSRERVWGTFRQIGVNGLSDSNGLTTSENNDLLHTPSLDHAVKLILRGLSRM
jgi:hypothetical protein